MCWLLVLKWASAQQNQQNDLCAQRRLRSAWASGSDQTERMSSLAWVFTGSQVILFVLSCDGSNVISARPWSAECTIGICFETAKKTKAFECFFTGFQHSLWKVSTNGNLYSLKAWLWLAAVACVVRWPVSNALLNGIWLTRFTRICN